MSDRNGKHPRKLRTASHAPPSRAARDATTARGPDESPPTADDAATGRTDAQGEAHGRDGLDGARGRGVRRHFAPETWDRQPKETERAYAAFLAYRDMGPDRSIVRSYRLATGRKEATDVSGDWIRWSTAHKWRARALDFDNHRAAVERAAVDDVAAATARKWAQRLDASAEADWQVVEALRKKVAIWAAMPPIARTPLPDGRTLVEAVGIRDTERVAKIAQAVSQMAYAAIAQALPDLYVDFDPHTATTEELTAAIERIEAVIGPAPARPRIPRIPRTD
jgi:hypothetical protein